MMITALEVVEGLTAIVAEEGEEFIYQKRDVGGQNDCRYVYEGKPDCLVGRYLHSVGTPLEYLEECDRDYYHSGRPAQEAAEGAAKYRILFEPKALSALQAAQSSQDAGNTWGAAVEAAKSYAE